VDRQCDKGSKALQRRTREPWLEKRIRGHCESTRLRGPVSKLLDDPVTVGVLHPSMDRSTLVPLTIQPEKEKSCVLRQLYARVVSLRREAARQEILPVTYCLVSEQASEDIFGRIKGTYLGYLGY
jgi:hypothetical protein